MRFMKASVCVVGVSVCVFGVLVSVCRGGELLQPAHSGRGGTGGWLCVGFPCHLLTSDPQGGDSHDLPLRVSPRNHGYEGPSRPFNITPNFMYSVRAYVSILNDTSPSLGAKVEIVIKYHRADGSSHYLTVARHPVARVADGWVLLQGDFKCPSSASMQRKAEMKIQVVEAGVEFLVRGPSVTNIWYGHGWRPHSDTVIQHVRQSNIALNVTTTGNVDPNELRIQVVQKSKTFPLGTVVNSWTYVDERKWRYRDFIHTHFNWAVLESSLKWGHVEPSQGHYNFNLPLRVVDSLKNKGLKIRGHNLIWPLESLVPSWVKELSGEDLRAAVQDHISHTMNRTRGRLEHWDVMNENLHGQWFQERLGDFSFEQTPFRLAHSLDSHVKLFLNDYDIVAHGKLTGAYVAQTQRLQKAGVGLQGLGVQCHFWNEEEPDPYLIKDRLDKLAQTGLPVWVTEFNVVAANETRRADFVEKAMRAFYGHPAVEGILIWGFWDQSHSRGPNAALTKGDTMQLTSAGERFLDLWERQWMTDETHVLSESGSRFNVRGFHGDYEMHVWYQGKELVEFRQNFTLGKTDRSIDVTVRL